MKKLSIALFITAAAMTMLLPTIRKVNAASVNSAIWTDGPGMPPPLALQSARLDGPGMPPPLALQSARLDGPGMPPPVALQSARLDGPGMPPPRIE